MSFGKRESHGHSTPPRQWRDVSCCQNICSTAFKSRLNFTRWLVAGSEGIRLPGARCERHHHRVKD
jgi:hypothetical protein